MVGRLGRAVALAGEIELRVLSDAPDRFAPGSVVLTLPEGRPLTVRSVRPQGTRTVVAFEEVTDRTGAEALRGVELAVPASQARPLDEGEYWDHDLVGCEVVTTAGRTVGHVSDVLHAPANDVLVVHGDGGEHLVPLIRDVIRSVVPGVRIEIDPIPGLLGD